MVLTRSPHPDESSIAPLVARGVLGCTFSLSVPSEVAAAAERSGLRPLFAQAALFSLFDGAKTLGSASAIGAEAFAALSANLDRDQAIQVHAAIDGISSNLALRTKVSYRTAAADAIALSGSWARIHAAIARHLDADGTISLASLRQGFAAMVAAGTISVHGQTSGPAAAFDAFLRAASFLLSRRTPSLSSTDQANRFSLRARPPEGMPMHVTLAASGAGKMRTVARTTPLHEILGGSLAGFERDRFIHLVLQEIDDEPPRSVPRLVVSSQSRDAAAAPRPLRLAALPGGPRSLALALTPELAAAPKANELLASNLLSAQLMSLGHVGIWAADDVVLPDPDGAPSLESLPLVEDPAAPIWQDRVAPEKYWYAPAFTLAQPQPSEDPGSASFLFTFRRAGVTVGRGLSIGLDATVRFTLEQTVPDATSAALSAAGNPAASPVPLGNLSAMLLVPFRDEDTGETRTQTFAADVQQRGNAIVATVDLLNDWARLCYGALAYPGFQAQPARLAVSYAYRAYTPIADGRPELLYGGKISSLQLLAHADKLPATVDRPVFLASNRTVHLPTAVLKLRPEARLGRGGPAAAMRGTLRVIHSLPAERVAGTSRSASEFVGEHRPVIAAQPNTIGVHPAVVVGPLLGGVIRHNRYAVRSLVQEVNLDTSYPCNKFGALYRQESQENSGTTAAVGCQDALRLGEVTPRLYEEIPELTTPRYRVLRSLQQPGRFLLHPTSFRITRYGPSEPEDRAYRPVILVYATLDPSPEKNRYFFTATLQADVPYFLRQALLDRLASYTPQDRTALLDLPTAPSVQAVPTYRWAVPDAMGEPEVLAGWDSFQVSISTGLADALTMATVIQTSGLTGSVTFTLPDDSSFSSSLVIDTGVVGPWDKGPVQITVSNGSATLTNRIEQPVSLTELVVGATTQRIPIDTTLAPGGATKITTAASPSNNLYVIYSVAQGKLTLQQLDVFVEDLTAQVLFVNLVNYANHGLTSLALALRLGGSAAVHRVDISENQTTSVNVTFPLDTYLQSQVIEFQVTKMDTAGAVSTTPWISWNLSQGMVIDITWERIQ
jgi:hypothetical protein